MVSVMDITTKHTNGVFFKTTPPKENTKSACNFQLRNLILESSSRAIVEDFYDPNLTLYIYPMAWSSGSKSLQCPSLPNDELAESAKMILSENNTRELIDKDIPVLTLFDASEDFEVHLLLFAVSFRMNDIIRHKLFDKIEQVVRKSDLNKYVKQSSEQDARKIIDLAKELQADLLKLSEYIKQANCLMYRKGKSADSTITLTNDLLQAKIKMTMSKPPKMGIPDMNGERLLPERTRSLSGELERVLSPVSLNYSVSGDIEIMLFALPALCKGFERTNYLGVLQEVIKTMPGVEIIVVMEMDRDTADIEEWEGQVEKEVQLLEAAKPQGKNTTLTIIQKDIKGFDSSFSIWTQDAVIPAKSEDGTKYLLTPLKPKRTERCNDGSIAKSVAGGKSGYHLRTFDFQLEGGNILVADDFILIGKDEVRHNGEGTSAEEFLASFKRNIGDERPVFFVETPFVPYEKPPKMKQAEELERSVGEVLKVKDYYSKIYNWRGEEQPIFHIDVFMTLLGYNENGDYELLVGEPISGFDLQAPDIDEEIRTVFDYQLNDAKQRIDECIENLQTTFKKRLNKTLKIHRNPLPLTFYREGLKYYWYWATYNNCLIQNGTKKTVWIPTYGHDHDFNTHWNYLEKYDIENQEIFNNLGFEAHLLDTDFNFFARRSGSLHCLSQTIKRTVLP